MTGRIHGTRTAYRNGCGCDQCVVAEADYQAGWRNRRQAKPATAPLVQREDWMADGLCHNSPTPELWFPKRGDSIVYAIAICGTCPVKAQCLEYALVFNERHGVWGSKSERQRRVIRRERRKQQAIGDAA